jgi:hypothetical protein
MRVLIIDPDPARAALVAEKLDDVDPRDLRRTGRLRKRRAGPDRGRRRGGLGQRRAPRALG